MKNIINRSAWVFMFLLALGISIYAATYLNLDSGFGFLETKEAHIINRLLYRLPFWIHVAGGIIALSLGSLQFLSALRKRRTQLHRTIGKIYVIAIGFAGLSGIPISLMAEGGWIARIGFLFLALAWLFTTAMAYLKIRQRDIQAHRSWMIRSYAVTFAAVTLRIWLGILMGALGWDFELAYQTVAWICWVPNLLVVQLFFFWSKKTERKNTVLEVSGTYDFNP